MYKFTQEKIDKKIELHELWLNSKHTKVEKLVLWYRDLSNLDFSNHDLEEAEFHYCNLGKTNFSGSNLGYVWFGNCDNLETIITDANTLPKIHCPESGEFVGYKKCRIVYGYYKYFYGYCVVKLLIAEDAKRSS